MKSPLYSAVTSAITHQDIIGPQAMNRRDDGSCAMNKSATSGQRCVIRNNGSFAQRRKRGLHLNSIIAPPIFGPAVYKKGLTV